MKATLRLKVLLCILAALVALSVILIMVDLLPELKRMRQRREELEQIEAEIRRSLLEVRLRAEEADTLRPEEVPELPEIAAFITSLRRARESAGIDDMVFESVQTERQELAMAGEMNDEALEYVLSRINVSFSSSMWEAADFIRAVREQPPVETFDYLRFASKSPDYDRVDVTMAVRLHGIPR